MHHTWRVFLLLMYIQISPALLRVNIPKNPASLRVSLGCPHWLGDSPRCSQTFHNHSHGAPILVIRDPTYSECRPECPLWVWFSPEIDASKFTLRLLSDTPGGSQWLKYILLMWEASVAGARHREAWGRWHMVGSVWTAACGMWCVADGGRHMMAELWHWSIS